MINRKVNLIYGTTGSGKTTLAKKIVAPERRQIILDCDFNEFPADYYAGDFIDFAQICKTHHAENCKINFTPLADEYDFTFNIIKIFGEYGPGPTMLILEEADRFYKSRQFDEVITRGRHYNLNITAIVIRPYLTYTSLRSVATDIYLSKFSDPRDLNYFSQFVGPDEILALKKYEFIHIDLKGGTTEKISS